MFWSDTRFQFIVSDAVIAEISVGDNFQVTDRLKAFNHVDRLIERTELAALGQYPSMAALAMIS